MLPKDHSHSLTHYQDAATEPKAARKDRRLAEGSGRKGHFRRQPPAKSRPPRPQSLPHCRGEVLEPEKRPGKTQQPSLLLLCAPEASQSSTTTAPTKRVAPQPLRAQNGFLAPGKVPAQSAGDWRAAWGRPEHRKGPPRRQPTSGRPPAPAGSPGLWRWPLGSPAPPPALHPRLPSR